MDWPDPNISDPDPDVARRLFCTIDAAHWCGVVVSTRTDRHQLFPREEGGRLLIDVRPVDGQRPVEANFFCVRCDTWKGLFSYYRGSYSLQNGFLADVWRGYRTFLRLNRPLRHDGSWSPGDSGSVLYTREGFRRLIESLDELHMVRVTSYRMLTSDDQPVSNDIRSVLRQYRLVHRRPSRQIIDWILGLRDDSRRVTKRGDSREHGAVDGLNEHKLPVTIDFHNSMQDYLRMTHDDIGPVDTSSLADNPIIARLRERIHAEALFGLRSA